MLVLPLDLVRYHILFSRFCRYLAGTSLSSAYGSRWYHHVRCIQLYQQTSAWSEDGLFWCGVSMDVGHEGFCNNKDHPKDFRYRIPMGYRTRRFYSHTLSRPNQQINPYQHQPKRPRHNSTKPSRFSPRRPSIGSSPVRTTTQKQ